LMRAWPVCSAACAGRARGWAIRRPAHRRLAAPVRVVGLHTIIVLRPLTNEGAVPTGRVVRVPHLSRTSASWYIGSCAGMAGSGNGGTRGQGPRSRPARWCRTNPSAATESARLIRSNENFTASASRIHRCGTSRPSGA
jgi:hypothetical protein